MLLAVNVVVVVVVAQWTRPGWIFSTLLSGKQYSFFQLKPGSLTYGPAVTGGCVLTVDLSCSLAAFDCSERLLVERMVCPKGSDSSQPSNIYTAELYV